MSSVVRESNQKRTQFGQSFFEVVFQFLRVYPTIFNLHHSIWGDDFGPPAYPKIGPNANTTLKLFGLNVVERGMDDILLASKGLRYCVLEDCCML